MSDHCNDPQVGLSLIFLVKSYSVYFNFMSRFKQFDFQCDFIIKLNI